MAQAERDYSHRDVVDKLGIKPGAALAFGAAPRPIDPDLQARCVDRAGRPVADADEPLDVVLVGVDAGTDAVELLTAWRARLAPSGGIWLLSPKRGQPGYVNQTELIEAGPLANVVDNKICSVSATESAIRFVIRRADRVYS